MIKKTIFVLMISMLCLLGNAQSKFVPEWNFGANFGLGLPSMSFVPDDREMSLETSMIQRFRGGLSVRYITEKSLGFVAELNYAQLGYAQKFEDPSSDSEFVQDLSYIQVPFLTHIYFGNKNRVFINLGPQVGFLIGEKKEKKLSASDLDENINVVAHYDLKAQHKIDYGLVVGLGYELRTGIGSFSLEGRYYFGLSDIYSSHKKDPFSRSAHRVISAGLTYYLKPF